MASPTIRHTVLSNDLVDDYFGTFSMPATANDDIVLVMACVSVSRDLVSAPDGFTDLLFTESGRGVYAWAKRISAASSEPATYDTRWSGETKMSAVAVSISGASIDVDTIGVQKTMGPGEGLIELPGVNISDLDEDDEALIVRAGFDCWNYSATSISGPDGWTPLASSTSSPAVAVVTRLTGLDAGSNELPIEIAYARYTPTYHGSEYQRGATFAVYPVGAGSSGGGSSEVTEGGWYFIPIVGGLILPISLPSTTVHEAPTINSTAITAATVDEQYTYAVSATDPQDSTITYSLTTKPTGMTISSTTGLIEWTPSTTGSESVTVVATNGYGLTDTQGPFTITVSEPATTTIDATWLADREAPYLLTSSDTTYKLATDVTTDGTAFVVGAHNVTLDLNGHTVTFGNKAPVEVANGRFEDLTDGVPDHWDLSNAPSAAITTYRQMWGSNILKFTDVTEKEWIKSDTFALPEGGVDYVICAAVKARSYNVLVRLQLYDADTGDLLRSGTQSGGDLGRGFTNPPVYTADQPRNVYVEVVVEPAEGTSQWAYVDDVIVRRFCDHGIVCCKDTYLDTNSNFPTQLQASRIVNAMANSGAFILTCTSTGTQGSIVQGQSKSHTAAVMWMRGINDSVTMDGITASSNGVDSNFVYSYWSGKAITVNGCTYTTTNDRITRRMTNSRSHVMVFQSAHAVRTVTNNVLSGLTGGGIVMSSGRDFAITGNNISIDGSITNSYGVSMDSVTDGEVANNTITANTSGRGIIFGVLSVNPRPMSNVNIHHNTISVKEVPNFEYPFGGLEATGIRVRDYGSNTNGFLNNINIYNNDITAWTDEGYARQAVGIRMSLGGSWTDPSEISIYDNTIKATVDTTNTDYDAIAFEPATVREKSYARVTGNVFESNSVSLGLGGVDGNACNDTIFVSNECRKSVDGAAVTHKSVVIGWGEWTGIQLIDMTYTGGATSTFTYRGTSTKTLGVGWLLDVLAQDASTAPIEGATVTVEDSDGTISYDLTGGTNERELTLTGGVWPANVNQFSVTIGGVDYPVDERISDTVVTLGEYASKTTEDPTGYPDADIAAGTAYTLTIETGTTGATGLVSNMEILHKTITAVGSTATEVVHAHTVGASAAGYDANSASVTVDSTKTETITLAASE